MEKLLSVIIPSYNSAEFVETAVDSVLLLGREDIEVIVVNDGSTDNTEEVLSRYSEDGRVIVTTVTNHGTGYARNIGISLANGKWIAFLDADDAFIYGTKLCERLLSTDGGTDIIYAPRAKVAFDLTGDIELLYPEKLDEVINKTPRLEFWAAVYKAAFLKENNIRFYEYQEQDIETAFRYLCFSTAKNAEVDDRLFFIIQRVSLKSNTHTWNFHKLYRVKSLVFFDLFERTRFDEDKEYLFGVAFDFLKRYFDYCAENGIEEKEKYKTMRDLLKRMIASGARYAPKGELSRINRRSLLIQIKNKRYLPSPAPVPENPAVTNSEAIKRLKELQIKTD